MIAYFDPGKAMSQKKRNASGLVLQQVIIKVSSTFYNRQWNKDFSTFHHRNRAKNVAEVLSRKIAPQIWGKI